MAKALKQAHDPVEDFLDWERRQEARYEYDDGEVRMMVGAGIVHHRLTFNLRLALTTRLSAGPCEVFDETVKLRVDQRIFYPDVFVVCGGFDRDGDVVEDPVIVAEVLSPSTAGIDRGRKWDVYRGIAMLQHYLLVDQDAARVLLHTRDGTRWVLEEVRGRAGVLSLAHPVTMAVPLEEIYARVDVPD